MELIKRSVPISSSYIRMDECYEDVIKKLSIEYDKLHIAYPDIGDIYINIFDNNTIFLYSCIRESDVELRERIRLTEKREKAKQVRAERERKEKEFLEYKRLCKIYG